VGFKYGLPVWYGNIDSIDEEIERARRLGFDYVEISLDFPLPEILGKREIAKILATGRKNRISFAFHAPPAGLEIGSPRTEIRKAATDFTIGLMRWTKRFKPLYFNLHGDAGEDDVVGNELGELTALAACAKSCMEIKKAGKRMGIVPTFENTPDPLFGLSSSVDAVLSSGMALCFDIGHAEIVNEISTEALGKEDRPLKKWVSLHGARMRAIHFHNIKRGSDHFPLFSGDINMEKSFKLLSGSAAKFMTIEIIKEAGGPVEKVSDKTLARCLGMVKGWEKGK
jgi:sugar phosphate isomerase/epimerase